MVIFLAASERARPTPPSAGLAPIRQRYTLSATSGSAESDKSSGQDIRIVMARSGPERSTHDRLQASVAVR